MPPRRPATPATTTKVSRTETHDSLQLRVTFPGATRTFNLSLARGGVRASSSDPAVDRAAFQRIVPATDRALQARPHGRTPEWVFDRLCALAQAATTLAGFADAVTAFATENFATHATLADATQIREGARVRDVGAAKTYQIVGRAPGGEPLVRTVVWGTELDPTVYRLPAAAFPRCIVLPADAES